MKNKMTAEKALKRLRELIDEVNESAHYPIGPDDSNVLVDRDLLDQLVDFIGDLQVAGVAK